MQPKNPHQKLITDYRPVVRAREGRMFGMRQPLDGPILEKLRMRAIGASMP